MRIRQVDPRDDAAVAAWFGCYLAAERVDRPRADDYWTLPDVVAELRQDSAAERRRIWSGEVDGDVVAAGSCALRLRDNLHRAEIGLYVRPAQRCHGHGSAMLAQLEGFAASQGRTTLGAEAAWPYELGPTGEGHTGVRFARRHGYELGLTSVHRMLTLPIELPEVPTSYDVRTWVGPVPDELAAGWAALDASLETEAPRGSLDLENHVGDVAELRDAEALVAAQGRQSYGAAVVAEGEVVVGYTQLLVSADGTRADQEGTLVRADHRGHRLGLVLKAANLRQLPCSVRAVSTYNAEENAHMVAVNDLLGFVPVEYEGEFQKPVRQG